MVSKNSLQKVLIELIPESTLCYQRVHSKHFMMLSETNIEEIFEIQHSEMAQTIFIEVGVDFFLQVWVINIMKMHIIRILKNNKHYASKSSLLQIKYEVTQNMKFEYFT